MPPPPQFGQIVDINSGRESTFIQAKHTEYICLINSFKCPATRIDFVNDIVNDARADAIFATLKAIVDDEKSTISLRVAWPLVGYRLHLVPCRAITGSVTRWTGCSPFICSSDNNWKTSF